MPPRRDSRPSCRWKADQSERQTVGQTADDDEASASRTIRESPLGGVRRQLHTPGLETLGDRVARTHELVHAVDPAALEEAPPLGSEQRHERKRRRDQANVDPFHWRGVSLVPIRTTVNAF